MNALVVGCGSIGRRHIKNILGFDEIDKIYIHSGIKDCLGIFGDRRLELAEDLNTIKADFAIIANETYKHIDTALLLADKGINLFIEKPISHKPDKLELLEEKVKRNNIKLLVGYNLRFAGCMTFLKEQLNKKVMGELYFSKIEAGQYLPDWRKNIDYRKSYSAYKEKGGGVSLDLSHEIDYMRYLFGDPVSWKLIKTKTSSLEIDSDDVFEGLYLFDNNFVCNVHLDYLQKDKKRFIRITGSKGCLECDFVKKKITINYGKEVKEISDGSYFDIEKTYKDELRHFLDCIKLNGEPQVSFFDGSKALELIEDQDVRR